MNFVDMLFPVYGETVPTNHGYPLYSALSRALPDVHKDQVPFSFGWINGLQGEKGFLQVFQKSRLRCRLPAEHIVSLLPLTGRTLDVAGHPIRLGMPQVAPLCPVPSLVAKMATFKHAVEPGRFLEVARQKLALLGVSQEAEAGILLIQGGRRQNEPRRQILHLKGRRVVGFAVAVDGLSAEDSLLLQERGLGGRRRMGCGFFLPYRGKE